LSFSNPTANELAIFFNTGVATTAQAAVECRVEFGEVVYP